MRSLLERVQHEFHAACVRLVATMVDDADDALFELAAASGDDDACQRAAFDLARSLHGHRQAFLDRFEALLGGAGEDPLAPRQAPDAHAVRLASRAVAQFGPLLLRIGDSWKALAGLDVPADLLPVAPAQVAAAYAAARAELTDDDAEARYLDVLFVRRVVESLGREYAALYAVLVASETGGAGRASA